MSIVTSCQAGPYASVGSTRWRGLWGVGCPSHRRDTPGPSGLPLQSESPLPWSPVPLPHSCRAPAAPRDSAENVTVQGPARHSHAGLLEIAGSGPAPRRRRALSWAQAMAPALRCLLLLGCAGAARIGALPPQREPARRVNATESEAAVLPCVHGAPPAPLSWLWEGPGGHRLLSLNVSLGERPPRTGTGIGAWGALVLPNVSPADAGVYSCQWAQGSARSVLLNVPGSRDLYVSATQGRQVELPCVGAEPPAVEWFWDAGNGTHPFVLLGAGHQRNGSSLLIESLGPEDAGWYQCRAGNQSWAVHLRLGGEPAFLVQEGHTAMLPCHGSLPHPGAHSSLAWKRLAPGGSWHLLLEVRAQHWGESLFQLVLGAGAALVLPAVTPSQAGTYRCLCGNHSHLVELGVTARAEGWRPWIVGAAAVTYAAVGAASLYGYCRIRQALQSWRRRRRLTDPARRFFRVTGNGTNSPYGNVLAPRGPAGVGPTEAVPYEKVALGTRGQGRLLQAEGSLSAVESEDEEGYEHPDSEEEAAPEDGDNYENTARDVTLCMGDKGSSDGECYENTEEDSAPLSPGAARLITDLRMLLVGSEEPERERQDGRSEGSAGEQDGTARGGCKRRPDPLVPLTPSFPTGSQAYEEMAGALYAAPARHLHLRDHSQEEDADSYENMEGGLGCLLPPREGSAGLRDVEAARRVLPRSLAQD
ncbi:B-lymphocyte antigen CD19 isoform X2 [Pelodiscus sinensis]|uniref:B-lymphocyte antigen CD19 isoform X2 n=1 Tax=Pelodiscus sinensis TaxID=13735 RepID=UPI003F6C48A0